MAVMQLECQPIQDVLKDQDVLDINPLQDAFNDALFAAGGVKVEGKSLRNRSYNPVIDRWHIEQAWGDPERLTNEIQTIRRNVYTNLTERMFAVATYGTFEIKDKQLYSELLPHESFEQVLLRGANYRADKGSEEQEREGRLGELGGWLVITNTLTDRDTPVGTKILSLSPPGIIKDTSYDGRYVDIFELAEDNGKRYVKRLRTAVDLSWEEYEQLALSFDPTFMQSYQADTASSGKPRALDAWYLSHPITIHPNDEKNTVLKDMPFAKTAMSPTDFEKLFTQVEQLHLIDYYIDVIQQQPLNWVEVAKAFNTILTVADKIKEGQNIDEIRAGVMPVSLRRDAIGLDNFPRDNAAIAEALVGILGTQRVKQVGGGGCPSNRGFDFADSSNSLALLGSKDLATVIDEVLGNSVGRFGLGVGEDKYGSREFDCPACGKKNVRPENQLLPACQHCGSKKVAC